MTLVEAAGEFGVRSYGAAGRARHGIHIKREADRGIRSGWKIRKMLFVNKRFDLFVLVLSQ